MLLRRSFSVHCCIVFGLVGATLASSAVAADGGKFRVYFGTYTRAGKSEGIYRSEFDSATGQLSKPELAGAAVNPSFLVLHPTYQFLYAVSEGGGPRKKGEGPPSGSVASFAVDGATGNLTAVNSQESGGAGPCHVSIDKAGRNVLVANYGGGSCGVLPVNDDGSLAPMSSVQKHTGQGGTPEKPIPPRAHSINLDGTNRYAVCCDAGIDKVMVYRFDGAKGTITANDPPSVSPGPTTAPRHFAFHPNGKLAFVINEHTCSITAFQFDSEKGVLSPVQTISTLPSGHEVQKGYSTAEVVVHPSGKFVYGSNRGHDSIVAFRIDESTGKLTLVGHQGEGVKIPRNFNVDPTGRFALVANQAGGTVVVFAIDQETGALGKAVSTIELDSPVCIKFVPLAR